MSQLKIATYNVNGIRSALSKGLAGWIAGFQPDILCLQETKAEANQVDMSSIYSLGYEAVWHSAEKKGYSGVCTLFKTKPNLIIHGMGMDIYDKEGRILRTDWDDFTLLNCYFPSGTSGDLRQEFKMQFLDDFYAYVQELRKQRPNLIVAGDYNIAHEEIDIHDPKGNKNSSGFLPEERAWLSHWLGSGFLDSFRYCNPNKREYSWWSFRTGARAKNKGWRIDYISISETLADHLMQAGQDNSAVHSDHCPVWIDMRLN